MKFADKSPVVRFLTRHPETKVVLVDGRDKLTAMQILATILSREFTVGVGVNPGLDEAPDIVLLDGAMAEHVLGAIPTIRFDAGDRSTEWFYEITDFSLRGGTMAEFVYGDERISAKVHLLGEYYLITLANAIKLAREFEIPNDKIIAAIESIQPVAGRMCPREGLSGSIIIDDSADRSNWSAEMSLRVIYDIDAPSRILVTGSLDKGVWPFLSATLLSEVIMLGKVDPDLFFLASNAGLKISGFEDELSLLEYLRTRLEAEGIVLLDIPLPI